MNRENVVQPYSEFSHRKLQRTNTCYNEDEFQKQYAKMKELDI